MGFRVFALVSINDTDAATVAAVSDLYGSGAFGAASVSLAALEARVAEARRSELARRELQECIVLTDGVVAEGDADAPQQFATYTMPFGGYDRPKCDGDRVRARISTTTISQTVWRSDGT